MISSHKGPISRLLVVAVLSLQASACTQPTPVRVTVAADRGWQNSHIKIEADDPFEIEYISGTWTHWIAEVAPFGPGGGAYTCNGSACCEPLPGTASGALIGQVGDETFSIGLGGPFTVDTMGSLFLRLNDCDNALSDNQGSVIIEVVPQ